MPLMFSRLAHNFIKNGYYPTDEDTLQRILQALIPCETGAMRIFDPCTGEGTALGECKHYLGKARTEALGIEYNEARAWHAKSILDCCIHSDFMQCVITPKSMGLLLLNPPYGDLLTNQADLSSRLMKSRQRLEKLFYRRAVSHLQPDGILVFIVPAYALDAELAHWIAYHFNDVQIYRAATDCFQQVVIFGRRDIQDKSGPHTAVKKFLIAVGQGKSIPELPLVWDKEPYVIPALTSTACKFFTTRLDSRQLAAELTPQAGLWAQFEAIFSKHSRTARPSLMDLSNWHLALALAAGQVSGVIRSQDGRTWVIKGDALKTQQRSVEYAVNEKNEVIETVTLLDRFVPTIQALDMTAESPTFGHVLTIQ